MHNIINLSKKVLLITGGTGSFGEAVLRRLLDSELSEIRIFSRDEKKQDEMRRRYSNDKLKFYIGDIRERSGIRRAMMGVDYVFHAAALKQVPSCEFYPMEAVRTNVIGTENVLEASIDARVKKVVCLSTDKSVYPINAMGITKALMEKVMIATSRNLEHADTTICATRYGNVLGSRGSVVPLFIDQIKNGEPVTITNPQMTRFMMSLEEAVELVIFAFENGKNGDIFVQKSPAATVGAISEAVLILMGKKDYPVQEIGTRHGEKLYESLLAHEELMKAEDLGNYYRLPPDDRDLNYSKYVETGRPPKHPLRRGEGYHSHNTVRLDVPSVVTLLKELDFVKRVMRL